MNKLGEIMRRQQEMMNETFRMDQMQRGQRQRGQNRRASSSAKASSRASRARSSSQGQGMTPEEFAEALKQLQEGQGKLQRRPASC